MLKNFFLMLFCIMFLVACGDRVTVNNGEKGKQLTSSGLEEEIREPGSFRMETCFFSACPRLVRLQTAMSANTIKIDKIFLPKSNVTLDDVTFGIQFRVKNDKKSINSAYETIRAIPSEEKMDSSYIITDDMIFNTYVARKAPEIVISALRNYTIDEALSDSTAISEYVKNTLNIELKDSPIEITEFGFPNGIGVPPKVVLDAKEKLYAVEEDRARKVKELEAAQAIEDQRQAVQSKRAKNDAVLAKELGLNVDVFMTLKTLERFADAAENGTPVAIGGNLIPIKK